MTTAPTPDVPSARTALEAERAELIAKNEAATSWGAAVGARSERIKEIDSTLARLDAPMNDRVELKALADELGTISGSSITEADILIRAEAALRLASPSADVVRMREALKEIVARTYSTDRRCRLDYEPVAEICDIAKAAIDALVPADGVREALPSMTPDQLGLAIRLVIPDELPKEFFVRGSDLRVKITEEMARRILIEYDVAHKELERKALAQTEGGKSLTSSDGGEPDAERTQRRLAVSDDGLGPMQAIPREPPSGPSEATPAPADPNLTPRYFLDDILSACDASNWDADRNIGDYFKGLKDAYEAIHEIAAEYQTSVYAWCHAQPAPADDAAVAWENTMERRLSYSEPATRYRRPLFTHPAKAVDVEAVKAVVCRLLYDDNRERDYPVYKMDDDRGLDEQEYVEFASDVIALLNAGPGQTGGK